MLAHRVNAGVRRSIYACMLSIDLGVRKCLQLSIRTSFDSSFSENQRKPIVDAVFSACFGQKNRFETEAFVFHLRHFRHYYSSLSVVNCVPITLQLKSWNSAFDIPPLCCLFRLRHYGKPVVDGFLCLLWTLDKKRIVSKRSLHLWHFSERSKRAGA